MDSAQALEVFLAEESASGVSEDTKKVLLDEGIVSKAIFSSLREEHFERLLPRLKVGQHALLLKIWDRQNNWRSRVGHLMLRFVFMSVRPICTCMDMYTVCISRPFISIDPTGC